MTSNTVETVEDVVVHETEHYKVIAYRNPPERYEEVPNARPFYNFVIDKVFYPDGYIVVNKTNGTVEYMTPQLPDAIHQSENMTDALCMAPWKWFAKRRELIASGRIKDDNEAMLEHLSGGSLNGETKVSLVS